MKNEEVMLHKFGRRFSKGAVLFRDGDSSKEMYVIHSGRVKITKRLASRILEANEKIENLMLRDNMSRIVHMLMHMVEAGGVKEGDYVRINISPRELANEADIDVRVGKDLMNRLSEAGIITFEEKAIKIEGINKLRFFDFLAVKKESGRI